MLNQELRMDIKQLHREGHTIKELARMTGHARNTIRKILRDGYVEKPRQSKKTILDEYLSYIENKFKEGRPVPRILQDLRKMGYEGSESQVYRFLKPFRNEIKRKEKLTVRFETAPGEQAQVDWGHCGHVVDLDGKKHKLYVFAYLLSYSRACYVEFTTTMNFEAVIRCHRNAFDYFGGVPEKILYDNMKTVRLSPNKLNPGFVDFAGYYGFCIKTCRPYRARTKGKVERLIRYFKDNFLPCCRFDSFEDANAQAHHWMEYEANCRIHGTTGQRPSDLLPNEALNDHRQLVPYTIIDKEHRTAEFDGFVRFKGNKYSLPPEAAGKEVCVEHIGESIKIYMQDMIVTEHTQPEGTGKTVSHKEHVAAMWKLTMALSGKTAPPAQDIIQFDPSVESRSLSVYDEACQ